MAVRSIAGCRGDHLEHGVELAVIAYFHRLTTRILGTLSDALDLGRDGYSDSESEFDEDGNRKKRRKKGEVRTKYDRMFERVNQDVLTSHYTKMVGEDGQGVGGAEDDEDDDEGSEEEDEGEDEEEVGEDQREEEEDEEDKQVKTEDKKGGKKKDKK